MPGLRGAQFEHQPAHGESILVSESLPDGLAASIGVNTLLTNPNTGAPIKLLHQPVTASSVVLFVADAPNYQGLIQRNGVDFAVDPVARTITWLATARRALVASQSRITVRYWRRHRWTPSVDYL